jgi:hypothetical protein
MPDYSGTTRPVRKCNKKEKKTSTVTADNMCQVYSRPKGNSGRSQFWQSKSQKMQPVKFKRFRTLQLVKVGAIILL